MLPLWQEMSFCTRLLGQERRRQRGHTCIAVKGGKMGVSKKYRGNFARVLPMYIADRIGDGADICTKHVFVTHAGCDPEIIEECVAKVKSYGIFEDVMVSRAGCTVSSHCGRNTLGVLFIRKNPIV